MHLYHELNSPVLNVGRLCTISGSECKKFIFNGDRGHVRLSFFIIDLCFIDAFADDWCDLPAWYVLIAP